MTRLIITRHGETEWNVRGLVQGSFDSPLTPVGKIQAERLSDRLEVERIDCVFSSPSGRAFSTARIIAEPRKLEVVECPEFREINFGLWEGKSWRDLRSQDPDLFAQWERHPYLFQFPEGESMEQVLQRVRPRILRLCQEFPDKSLCLVSHGITVKVLVTFLMGLSLAEWLQTPWQTNTALNIFEVNGDKVDAIILGDNSHVESSTA